MVMSMLAPTICVVWVMMCSDICSKVIPATKIGPISGSVILPSRSTVRLCWALTRPQSMILTSSPGPTT
ncbi:MAG: hypothetical protein A4E69_00205 [Syntrophus sp. PtaB.Bin138]|nr:MAG: hypothetical protein A4E69_00205 [Syntrophus sp. PtaB.Bin138]